MPISDLLNRRVRARPEEEEEIYSDASAPSEDGLGNDEESEDGDMQSQDSNESDTMNDNSDDDDKSDQDAAEEDSLSDDNDDLQTSLNNISFGALAKAQASMGPKKRKNKLTTTASTEESTSALDDIRAQIRAAREQRRSKAQEDNPASTEKKEKKRSSKHAPMVQSSKYAVSRKRTVIEPAAVAKARDPRFDAAVMGHSGAGKHSEAASKAYAFLDEYRASELKDLKEQFAKTKNAQQKEALKKQIRSASDKMRAMEARKRERDVIADHKKKEKQLIREGKKSTPYYLKKSDLKKQVMMKKYEEMGSRDRAKALERRRKKMASKERKNLPMERRGLGGDGGDEPSTGHGAKRRRLS
ncbi:rRNA biogenesis protein rrp36 [Penicillium riverlandense]|uniref:rRNA biogenesis protein rrp36 n=1 Tax=Penicillium riverlandense TaxID=1903569 RepID=UPI002547D276|nr:rRNA biogenesis protein rrp36 [Penicillium riverlandense]KAJ5826175.1 rRNA biogenesis protein rrp36 [Penicillium riverlandense]